jgi:hypothetical protein
MAQAPGKIQASHIPANTIPDRSRRQLRVYFKADLPEGKGIIRDFDKHRNRIEYKSPTLPSQIDVSICYKDFIFVISPQGARKSHFC